MSIAAPPTPTPTSTPPPPPPTPPVPPNRTQTAPSPSSNGRSKWWFWAIVITALIGLWWLFKPSNAKAKGGNTPSDEFRRQQQGTNELSELRQKFAELSARLAAMSNNSSPAAIVASTNTTPTITGLGGTTTNVYSTVVSSNISGVVITAGGGVNYTTIITNMPAGMVVMELMKWPSWVKADPTNTFTAPGPRIKVGEMTTLRICKGHALEINLEAGYSLHPDVNDLQKVTMLWGDQRGCLTFDPDRQFRLPLGHVGPVRNLIWITPDSPEEAVEFRFMVVPK